MLTYEKALTAAGWEFDDGFWIDPKSGRFYETDREACAALERGKSLAYDSNYSDERE
jgi:hypothetical protein